MEPVVSGPRISFPYMTNEAEGALQQSSVIVRKVSRDYLLEYPEGHPDRSGRGKKERVTDTWTPVQLRPEYPAQDADIHTAAGAPMM